MAAQVVIGTAQPKLPWNVPLLVQSIDVYLFVGVPVPSTEYMIEESQHAQVLYQNFVKADV